MAVADRRPVAPVEDDVAARGFGERAVGMTDRVDGQDTAVLVDRQPQRQRRFLPKGLHGNRIWRFQVAALGEQQRSAVSDDWLWLRLDHGSRQAAGTAARRA